MKVPPTTDKVWLHTGVIVCGCDIQSEPHESESETYLLLLCLFEPVISWLVR